MHTQALGAGRMGGMRKEGGCMYIIYAVVLGGAVVLLQAEQVVNMRRHSYQAVNTDTLGLPRHRAPPAYERVHMND